MPFRRHFAVPVLVAVALGATLALRTQAPPPRAIALAASEHARQLDLDRGADAVWQSLKKLHTRASLLLVVAHPDDEDSGMLTYESRGQGVRAAMLTLNRGEGGLNVMSGDFYDALGLVRTQELLSADRYFGVQQYFTSVVDFGFSKTKEETFAKWGHDRVLEDAVRVVRMTRPLVIASVFLGGPSDGHGNHAAAGQIAQELFTAAGDPNLFPDQIAAGLRPWNPLKMYARVPVGAFTARGIYDSANGVYAPDRVYDYIHKTWIAGQPSITLEVPEGPYDPVLGATYLQIARQGLGEQRTQNGGIGIPDPAPATTPYHRFGSRVKSGDTETSYFDGIDTSLAGIADLAPGADPSLRAALVAINRIVEQATRQFSAAAPEAIAPLLAKGLAATNDLIAQVEAGPIAPGPKADVVGELKIKQAQFNDAIVEALGLSLSASVGAGDGGRGGPLATFQVAIPGQTFPVQVHLVNSSREAVDLTGIDLTGPPNENWTFQTGATAAATLRDEQGRDARIEVTIPAGAKYTRPYYSRPNTEQPYYDILDPRYLTLPQTPYPLAAWAHLRYQGVAVELGQVVQTVERINGPGVIQNPLVVAPAISVAISPRAGVVPLDAPTLTLNVTVHSNVQGAAAGTLRLRLPEGWTSQPAVASFRLAHDGEDQPLNFQIHPGKITPEEYTITAAADYGGHTYEEGYHLAGYTGLPPSYLYSPATYRARGVAVTVAPNLNVAYVTGTGDDVPQSLEDLGVHVHFLGAQDLASADLSRYDAIVLGIRAYSARPELRADNGRLLDYVKNGGALVVQFQTSDFNNYGPYPFNLVGIGERVVDEAAPVRILLPGNPLLNWPNHITGADFSGWVEERGHGFLGSWDPQYQALVETHDPDQPPQAGGMLYARYGKGEYIYAGLALYRQLDAAVPGAYRIFANLISVARAPKG